MINKLLILACLLMILLLPSSTYAAEGDIKLLESSTVIDFPGALTFNIKAESGTPITRIRLRYEIDKRTYVPAYAETWLEFTSSKNVQASWTWDMRTTLTPPGALVTYWWVIEDSAGNRLITPKESVNFNDDRYDWQQISLNKITLYWYEGDSKFAEELLNAGVQAVEQLGKDTGTNLENPVRVYIYAGSRDLVGSLTATEEWTGGVKYTDYNVISIGISTNNLEWGKKAIAHELGHQVTEQLLTSPYAAFLPLWINEGLAVHAEGKQKESTRDALIKAIRNGNIATLKSLSGPFPADANATAYAYAQSQSVVEYMLDIYGNQKMHDMLVYFNEGNTIDESFVKVYGIDIAGMDEAWKKYMLSLN